MEEREESVLLSIFWAKKGSYHLINVIYFYLNTNKSK
jgi:hypothetical protein